MTEMAERQRQEQQDAVLLQEQSAAIARVERAVSSELKETRSGFAQLDDYRSLVQLEEMLRGAVKGWQERLRDVQQQLQDLVGDAEEATIDGKPVFTYRRVGRLREKDFIEAYPTMAEVYTDIVEKPELNIDALRAAHPDLYREFQSRVWRKVN